MNDHLSDIKRFISEQFERIEGRIEDIVPRHDFSKNCIKQWLRVVRNFYTCSCPCCRKVPIVDFHSGFFTDQVHLDHFNGRERNGAEDGWPVCKQCNQRLKSADFKESKRPHFMVFQDHRRETFMTIGYRRPQRKASGTVADQRQKLLFD